MSYRGEAASIYNLLRATWERALEDVAFFRVIQRHRDYINTRKVLRLLIRSRVFSSSQEHNSESHKYVFFAVAFKHDKNHYRVQTTTGGRLQKTTNLGGSWGSRLCVAGKSEK